MAVYPVNIDSFYDYQLEQSLNELSNVRGLLQESYLTEGVVGTIIGKIRKLWGIFRKWVRERVKVIKDKIAKLKKKKDPFDVSKVTYTWNNKWKEDKFNIAEGAIDYTLYLVPSNIKEDIYEFVDFSVFNSKNIDRFIDEKDSEELDSIIDEVHKKKLEDLHYIMENINIVEIKFKNSGSVTVKEFFDFCKDHFDDMKKEYKTNMDTFYKIFDTFGYYFSYLDRDQNEVEKKLEEMTNTSEQSNEEDQKTKLQSVLKFVQKCVTVWKQHIQICETLREFISSSFLGYRTMVEDLNNVQSYVVKKKGVGFDKEEETSLFSHFSGVVPDEDKRYQDLLHRKEIYTV